MGTIVCRAIFAALLPFLLLGCATPQPSRFTGENIAMLRAGMTTAEVEKLFGPPASIRNTLCGKEDKWHCEIWSYDRPDTDYLKNTFWFSVRDGRLLDQWDVTSVR